MCALPLCRLRFHNNRRPGRSLHTPTVLGLDIEPLVSRPVMVMHGFRRVCFASRLQKAVAFSSGKADLNAHVFGVSDGLGLAIVCEEVGGVLSSVEVGKLCCSLHSLPGGTWQIEALAGEADVDPMPSEEWPRYHWSGITTAKCGRLLGTPLCREHPRIALGSC